MRSKSASVNGAHWVLDIHLGGGRAKEEGGHSNMPFAGDSKFWGSFTMRCSFIKPLLSVETSNEVLRSLAMDIMYAARMSKPCTLGP